MMQEAHSFAISNGIEISYESVCLADDKHKTREENVSDSDNLLIIGLKKKKAQGSSKIASPTSTPEFMLFLFQFIHLINVHITYIIFHCSQLISPLNFSILSGS
ncbi:hypothetical protein ACE6H2_000347 [Prunus campanulata]